MYARKNVVMTTVNVLCTLEYLTINSNLFNAFTETLKSTEIIYTPLHNCHIKIKILI